MGARLNNIYGPDMQTETCCNCGTHFAMDIQIYKQRVEDHKSFFCPNGHSQHYVGETQADKLRKQLENEKRMHEWTKQREAQAKEDAKTFKKSAAAYKGHLNSTRKRVAHGVCPCCSRTFQNVMRHMKTKHPDYQKGHA